MRLAELSPAEQRYLSSPLSPVDIWAPLLTKRLVGMLRARMKLAAQLSCVALDPARLPAFTERDLPEIKWGSALETMWIRARLGGPVRINTRCTALSRNLQHSLRQLLAETWLSTPHEILPTTLCWRIEMPNGDNLIQATLTIHFPDSLTLMDRWAQRMIAS